MEEEQFYFFVWIWIGVALVVFPAALFVTAPYGRHSKPIGPMIQNRWGWLLMELPSPLLFSYFFLSGNAEKNAVHWIFFTLFLTHYIHRTFIWPFRVRSGKKKMPMVIMGSAVFFNAINGPVNGYFLGNFADYDLAWFSTGWFILGICVFLFGMYINISSDYRLINLRKPGETGYKIPYGGFFKWVSAPNIMGEIIEWIGWGIMTFSLPTLSFTIWSWANLLPRTLDHHKWYKEKFGEEYPKERKAVIPRIL